MARPRPIAPEVRAWLTHEVTTRGVPAVAHDLDVASATVLRIIAGLPVQVGTDVAARRAYDSRMEAA